jgi:uncharacterized membrane protein YkoI
MERKILIIVVFGILSFIGFSLAQEQTKMPPPEMKVAPTPVPVSIPVPTLPSETKPQSVSPFQIETKPIEIELKESTEAPKIEGCKNLCGDGICQEIVCMAIGCPCPETPQSCPQDCREKELPSSLKPVPVISLPAETKLEISPSKEVPVRINENPVEFKGTEVPTTISVEVKAIPISPLVEKVPPVVNVTIEIDKETKVAKIESEGVKATTAEKLKIEEKTLKIETPKGDIQVNVLPSLATRVAISKSPQEIKEIELKLINEKPIYEIKGKKVGKLLWLFPIEISVQTQIDATEGKILKIKKPWWSFLARF